MLYSLLAFVALLLTGCMTTAAYTTWELATDKRSFEVQHLDTEIAWTIKTRLLESDVRGTGWLEVYCRHGIVILTGVVEQGSPAGREAIAVARRVEGVRRIETYFVPSRPSRLRDFTIKHTINARMIADMDLKMGQVAMSVLAGHVVLVGVVNDADKVKKILGHAQATSGVVAVKSFIQVAAH